MKTQARRLFLGSALAALSSSVLMACSKTPAPAPAPPAPSISVGTQVDDAVVTAAVRAALMADDTVKSFDLQVETRKGVVQLSGFVDGQPQADQALAVTKSVAGVMTVENGITLKGSPGTVGTAIDDSTVTTRVKTALLADPGIKSLDISVVTFKGEVQLTGFVNNQAQIDLAAQLARAAEGATGLKNELKVKQ